MDATQQGLWLADAVKWASDGLVYIAPVDADKQHFFLSPEDHVIQALCFYIGAILVFGLAKCGTIHTPKPNKPAPPLDWIEWALRSTLTINLTLQFVYKFIRGWRILTYMFQPCHGATALYLYCMYSNNYSRTTLVFRIGLHYMFFTTLAIAIPDTAQLLLPFEVTNFWVQHYALLIAPLYLLATRRFSLHPSWALTTFAIGWGMVWHFVAQLPAALLSGVNVNYMLWPPPNVPPIFADRMWRVKLTFLFMFLAWTTGYILPKLVIRLQKQEVEHAKRHHQKTK